MSEKDEFDYLQYFYMECDFGPAHDDVVNIINENYEDYSGKKVPKAYRMSWDEEEE